MARVRNGWKFVFALAGALAGSGAHAQRAPDPGRDLELIESTERNEDPLGIDDSTGKDLERAAESLPKPPVILPQPSRGAALSAIPGVREARHRVTVELAAGLAFVETSISIASTSKHASELAYRLALPRDAVVTSICVQERCAAPDPKELASGRGPALYAEPIEDAQGRALSLRVAPVAAQSGVRIELSYVSEAPVRGGRARFALPARGYDPNLAPSELILRARGLVDLAPSTELRVDPWQAVELSGRVASPLHEHARATCGNAPCARSFEASPRTTPALRPTWLFIDASPSMEGPARGRVGPVLAALLASLPEQTELSAYAFAARASELGHFQASAVPLSTLADAPTLDLDAATHPARAFELARKHPLRSAPRILVLSDGLFDGDQRGWLEAAARLGAETFLLALGDGDVLVAGFAHTLALGALAERALHDDDLSALEDALSEVSAPRRPDGARAGEQRVHELRPRKPWPLDAHASWLAFWLRREQPVMRWQTAPASEPFIAAVPYASAQPARTVADTGMPKESVLSMLRTQLVPQARACLRTDRMGRANYAVGLNFQAVFAQREVYEPRIEGQIPRPLRECLLGLLPKLRVPAFSGRVRIRYPIHTERAEEPPVIELEPELGRQLERAFGGSHALP